MRIIPAHKMVIAIILIGFIIMVISIISGCIGDPEFTKTGVITKIDTYPFGGTFSDNMCVLVYDDNSELHLVNYYGINHRFILNETSEVTYSVFVYRGNDYNRFERFELVKPLT